MFPEFTMDPLFFREFTMISLSVLSIHYKSSFFIANSLSIRENTIDSRSVPRIYHEFTMIPLFFREFTKKAQPISRINFKFTPNFENSLWLHYLSCEFTINSLGVSRIYY